jgi:hypothetical protein
MRPVPPPPPGAVAAQAATAEQSPRYAAERVGEPVASEDRQRVAPVTSRSSSTTTAEAKPSIHLSAGIALPQLLPEGTHVGVSVDYKITGQLRTSSRYVLVVESSAGEITVPVQLSSVGGTIQGFCPYSVRPEHQPFRARIDEHSPSSSRGVRVSNTVALQTSY